MLPPPAHPFTSFPLEDQSHHRLAIDQAVKRVLDSGNYLLGDELAAFETEFAAFIGAPHVIGVANGTDAIELMLRGLRIGTGDKVLLPAHAPSAVAAGVVRSGAACMFADVEDDTFTLCPKSLDQVLSSALGRDARAILAVHLYGHPADWSALRAVADAHGVILLEDGAQAHGASWRGRKVGTLGRAAAFSFYPTKNLAAVGDAGAVVTGDEELAARIRELRQYGWKQRHVSAEAGINSRLDELQAAVLRAKLTTLAENTRRRQELGAAYTARLQPLRGISTPVVRADCEHVFHQYVLRCERRDELLKHLQAHDAPVAIHYPVPLHRQPAFYQDIALPKAERSAQEVLSLPLHPYLTTDAVGAVCNLVEAFGSGRD